MYLLISPTLRSSEFSPVLLGGAMTSDSKYPEVGQTAHLKGTVPIRLHVLTRAPSSGAPKPPLLLTTNPSVLIIHYNNSWNSGKHYIYKL